MRNFKYCVEFLHSTSVCAEDVYIAMMLVGILFHMFVGNPFKDRVKTRYIFVAALLVWLSLVDSNFISVTLTFSIYFSVLVYFCESLNGVIAAMTIMPLFVITFFVAALVNSSLLWWYLSGELDITPLEDNQCPIERLSTCAPASLLPPAVSYRELDMADQACRRCLYTPYMLNAFSLPLYVAVHAVVLLGDASRVSFDWAALLSLLLIAAAQSINRFASMAALEALHAWIPAWPLGHDYDSRVLNFTM